MTDKHYGIIGCGMMGQEHIKNINLLDGAKVAAVYDPVGALADVAATLAGDAKVEASFEAIMTNPELDAVVIVSPNYLHVDQLETILTKRTMPILCEKPLFTHPDDLRRVRALEAKFSGLVWIAMEYRYMPPIAQFLEQAEVVTGGIQLLTIREHRFPFLEKVGDWNRFNENTGGTLVEKCCHFFDLMRLIVKAEPSHISASAGQINNHKDEVYDGKTPDIWDAGYVLADFENGARAMLELCMFADGSMWQEEITAIGPLGKIECKIPGPKRFWPPALGPQPSPQIVVSPRSPIGAQTLEVSLDENLVNAGDHHGSTFYQHQKFLEVVRGKAVPQVSIADGRKAVQMGLAAQQAATTKQVINLTLD